jgi:hypothetical protein
MNAPQTQGDAGLALQYLGEVANTYANNLNGVEKAPFINQVNVCLKTIQEALAPPAPAEKPVEKD